MIGKILAAAKGVARSVIHWRGDPRASEGLPARAILDRLNLRQAAHRVGQTGRGRRLATV